MQIFKEFTFDSAHFLPNVSADHKCRNMHGHTYRLVVYVEGQLDPVLGWVMDFADLKKGIEPLIKQLDHHLLNEIQGLDNPTCEMLAVWIWDHIKVKVPRLYKIELHETPTSGVVYMGNWHPVIKKAARTLTGSLAQEREQNSVLNWLHIVSDLRSCTLDHPGSLNYRFKLFAVHIPLPEAYPINSCFLPRNGGRVQVFNATYSIGPGIRSVAILDAGV